MVTSNALTSGTVLRRLTLAGKIQTDKHVTMYILTWADTVWIFQQIKMTFQTYML